MRHGWSPDRPTYGEVYCEDEFVGVALGECAKALDSDGLQPGDDSRPAERDREHLSPFGRRDHQLLKRRSMLANSRLSDSYWASNSSSGMSGAWNIVKLKAVRPSRSETVRLGKTAMASFNGPA